VIGPGTDYGHEDPQVGHRWRAPKQTAAGRSHDTPMGAATDLVDGTQGATALEMRGDAASH